MPLLLMLLWLGSVIALWACAVGGFRDTAGEADAAGRLGARAALLLAVAPPTLMLVVTAFVLLQAAPTVQSNVGNSLAMSLWSFWVHWWQATFGCSGVQAACYFVWFIALLVVRGRPCTRDTVGLAMLASICGSLLLSMAYPTA